MIGAGLLGVALAFTAQATMLDNFNGPKTGWTDTLNSGSVNQGSGVFTITTANNNGALTYSRKTASSFAPLAGHTLEFRADVMSATPGAGSTAPLAILGWVPTGGALLGSGYSLTVGAGDVQIQKGPTVVFATNYVAAGTNIQNTNITLVLRLTPSGSAVSVNARVYRRIGDGVIGQYFTTLFEYTYLDSAGAVGQNGNASLGAKNQGSVTGVSVVFDNLQVFDTTSELLDDFNAASLDTTKWTVFRKIPGQGDSVTVSGGQLDALATVQDASGGFAGVYSANKTFKIVDGTRLEFQVDVIHNIGENASYSCLGYLPIASPQYIYGLIFYHLAHDYVGTTLALSGKGYNEWWGGRNDIQPPTTPPGCRYTMIMTGEGNNCRIESRMEDLSVTDVNATNRVVWQSEFVDTPAADPGLNEASLQNPFPYLNFDGRFTICTFNAGALPPNWARVLYDNAVVRQTLPPRAAPIIANVVPNFGSNFLASSSAVSFSATGSTNIPLEGLSVTLNGILYTNGSAGVTITPNTASSLTRSFTLAGALVANGNYLGEVRATDAFGLSSAVSLVFDTFLASNYLVESEEYNFSPDGGITGGSFLDNPLLIIENSGDPNAYNGQPGMAEVDYHDNRGAYWGGGFDPNHTFRTADPVYTSHSGDPARAKYVAAGGPIAGYYEHEINDIRDGDWVNYTHTYPAGNYLIYLRQATFQLQNSLVTLERVAGDRTSTNQTTSILGSFLAKPTGLGLFANVPLTDAVGNPIVLRASGSVDTLRVMNRVTGNADLDVGNLEQNYMIFVPTADPGTLRPFISSASPIPGDEIQNESPDRYATIVNRDTSVRPNTIQFLLNGNSVSASITPTAGGAEIRWPLAAVPGASTITNTLIFQDTGDVWQTNVWTYKYPCLKAANRLSVGSLGLRGFDSRMVQTDNGGVNLDNSLMRAMQQLAIPPQIPYDRSATSIVQVLNWTQEGNPTNVPGLCPGDWSNIAVESVAYLELSAGGHRFRIGTDDRSGLYSGASLQDPAGVTLWENSGATADTTFDFVVEAAGLYPVRLIWEETGGGARLLLNSVNEDGSQVAINDPANPTGVVKAYYPFICNVATAVEGPYVPDPTAVNLPTLTNILCGDTGEPINKMLTGGTVTVPIAGTARFYRLEGLRQMTITGFSKVGSNFVITYKIN